MKSLLNYQKGSLNQWEFKYEEFKDTDPIVKVLLNFIVERDQIKWMNLFILVFIPLLILSGAAILENRFFLKSVTSQSSEYGTILGMSFIGDSMVWPFCFLIPIIGLLLARSINYSYHLLNRLSQKVKDDWFRKTLPDDYDLIVSRVHRILQNKYGWRSFILKIAPWIIAISFWGYNTVTCAYSDILGEKYYPYTSSKIVTLDSDKKVIEEKVLSEKVMLEKWDTDRKEAPLSTYLTRLWVVIFYGLPPFLLARLITIIWAVTHYLNHFAIWAKSHKLDNQKKLLVIPFNDDGYGGLGFVAETGMSFFYMTVAFLTLVIMSIFKEGPQPSWHNYFVMLLFLPVSIFSFVIPAITVRNTIRDAKDRYMEFICDKINNLFAELLLEESGEVTQGGSHRDDALATSLKIFYDQVSSLQVWPFSSSAFIRIAGTMAIPIGMILYDTVIPEFISALVQRF